MSRNRWSRQNSLKIDKRNTEDIEKRIEELAASYTKEWRFDRENPDIGSALGILFARQMYENIGRYNQVIDKYHTEFVNMLGISLLPARAASSVVRMELVQDTVPGVEVKKHTKLLGGQGEEQYIFETASNIYVSNSRLTCAFMTDGEEGRVVPLLGSFAPPALLEPSYFAKEEEPSVYDTGSEEMPPADGETIRPFVLFGQELEGIEKNALLFFHETLFDVEQDQISVRLYEQSGTLFEKIRQGQYRFFYAAEAGLLPVEHIECMDDHRTIVLQKEQKNRQLLVEGRNYSAFILQAQEPVRESLPVERIAFSAAGSECGVEFAGNGTTDFDPAEFDLFGDTLTLFQECYIGHNAYFGKKGAHVQLTFDVSYLEHTVGYTRQQEAEELKVIKKKPKTIWTDTRADAYAEEISIEYFNGIGWKKLPCRHEYRSLFSVEKKGRYEISFLCPDDWEETVVGAYEGRCIRFQLLKSDNCYMRPCVHHYPHIKHAKVSYSYEGNYVSPQRLISIAGTSRLDLTDRVQAGKGYTAFAKHQYGEDALYLGFSKKLEYGPISLLFLLEEGVSCEGIDCRFEYSTASGFQQMKVVDHTMQMTRSGVVMFMPPANMAAMTLEGKHVYWIRMSRDGRKQHSLPKIRAILPNAVEVENIETKAEQDYYLEEAVPNMIFDLGVSDILDVELWVNEMGSHTTEEMHRLLQAEPERVRIEYGPLHEICAFYVRWEEEEQLYFDSPRRIYCLDRMNRQLLFGDGVHAQIPRVLDDVAFKMKIRCCNGAAGNVAAGQIREALGNLLFVNEITNPIKAFGGSDMESMDNALERGANILGARGRLVTMQDYEREILAHSHNIDKVAGIVGMTASGEQDEESITFVLLLKDFEAGSYSFHYEAGRLKSYLLKFCELTVAPDTLHIAQPVFVTISVDVWLQLYHMEEHFEVQSLLRQMLAEYLHPITTERGVGWKIGVLPQPSQIMMKLTALSQKAAVKKVLITASYTDAEGFHEKELSDVVCTPFMICRNGLHEIHQL